MSTPGPDVPPAPTSAVLCSAWAAASDVPERYRSLASDEQWADYLMQASEIVWALSGRRWSGVGCTAVDEIASEPGPGSNWPFADSWSRVCGCWELTSAGWRSGRADFTGEHYSAVAVRLRHDGATEVTEVRTADGVLVPSSAYRLTASGWLERTDGGRWSGCGEQGFTSVHYKYGVPPPVGGKQSAVLLAIEVAKWFSGDDSCQLPKRTTNISRQGVSVVLDPVTFLKLGKTGIAPVDLWLMSVNPAGRASRATVWSPDVPTTRSAP